MELTRECEKPDPRGLRAICSFLGVEPKEVLYVGDSLTKDIALAQEQGALDCWAEYGTYISQEYRERLSVISAPSATRRHLQQQAAAQGRRPPSVRLSSFEQVVDIVEASRSRGIAAA
jgi:phosphoglycolate phosphatase